MIRRLIPVTLILALATGIGLSDACANSQSQISQESAIHNDSSSTDTIQLSTLQKDSIPTDSVNPNIDNSKYTTLTEEDYKRVADDLGIEVAAIKAVVLIEAGQALEGFLAPGVPVINYDPVMYRKLKSNSTRKAPKDSKIPEGITSAYDRKEWQQLIDARKKNMDKANMATFWGMFQIGGFNYKICGCQSVDEFIEKMSSSEAAQLELFAILIKETKMVKYLQQKDWAGFARRYNGPGYAKRGYHKKMAKAYNKFKNQ